MLIHNVQQTIKRCARIKDHMIKNQKKTETEPLVKQILEMLDRDFKINMIKMSRKLRQK